MYSQRRVLRKLETKEIQDILESNKKLGNDKPSFHTFLKNMETFRSDWEAKMVVKVNRDGKQKIKWQTNTCNSAFKAIKIATTNIRCI